MFSCKSIIQNEYRELGTLRNRYTVKLTSDAPVSEEDLQIIKQGSFQAGYKNNLSTNYILQALTGGGEIVILEACTMLRLGVSNLTLNYNSSLNAEQFQEQFISVLLNRLNRLEQTASNDHISIDLDNPFDPYWLSNTEKSQPETIRQKGLFENQWHWLKHNSGALLIIASLLIATAVGMAIGSVLLTNPASFIVGLWTIGTSIVCAVTALGTAYDALESPRKRPREISPTGVEAIHKHYFHIEPSKHPRREVIEGTPAIAPNPIKAKEPSYQASTFV